jgi:hypothetical protein
VVGEGGTCAHVSDHIVAFVVMGRASLQILFDDEAPSRGEPSTPSRGVRRDGVDEVRREENENE